METWRAKLLGDLCACQHPLGRHMGDDGERGCIDCDCTCFRYSLEPVKQTAEVFSNLLEALMGAKLRSNNTTPSPISPPRPGLDVVRSVRKTTNELTTLRLSAATLRYLLAQDGADVPEGAEIYVRVPGGGDWSNSKLPIREKVGPSNDGVELLIEWETTQHEEY